MTTYSRTAMSYWLPRIIEAGLPVPRTRFVMMSEPAQSHIWNLFDGNPEPKTKNALNWFLMNLASRCAEVSMPCFLRTDHTSAKHSWRDSCHLPNSSRETLLGHVLEIAEFSVVADFMGLPWDTWAVRELLPTQPAFYAFRGRMPITCEFRIFVVNGELICSHPYWPKGAIEMHVDESEFPDWKNKLLVIQQTKRADAILLALAASKAVPGEAWSVDVLKTDRGWFITDMAPAIVSWHWPGCPTNGSHDYGGDQR